MNDWAELTVLIPSLARKLEGHLTKREHSDAEAAADELVEVAFEIKRLCIREQVLSGQGWK
jgi:hypothetical protein